MDIRAAAPADWAAIGELCADTGALGDPVEPEERAEFAERWTGPYRVLRPGWTFVAVEGGAVVGYLTGSPDSLGFEEERARVFKPEPDARHFFPMDFRLELWAAHPAHLHMNVAAPHRRRGVGAALLAAFRAALRAAGVGSMHVVCGEAAASYWRKAGFSDLRVEEPFAGVRLHAMTRPV
ncbi:MAG: GNAT family N-acetyltransferase [Elusimicrobiota bacterium]|nr:GNAT family N-acetyltransferase [Elusimicrobiota bacterium]